MGRLSNWPTLTEREREIAARRILKRNERRRAELLAKGIDVKEVNKIGGGGAQKEPLKPIGELGWSGPVEGAGEEEAAAAAAAAGEEAETRRDRNDL